MNLPRYMTKRTFLVAVVIAIVVVGVGSMAWGHASDGDDRAPVTYLSASWAKSYPTLGSLFEAADLVVVGTVRGVAGTKEDTVAAGAQRSSLRFTNFEIAVGRVISPDVSQSRVSAGAAILIHQTGGVGDDGRRVELTDDPLLVEGTTYLMFLQYNDGFDTYTVLGGPQGRMIVAGDMVTSLSRTYPGRAIQDLGLVDFPLADIGQQSAARSD